MPRQEIQKRGNSILLQVVDKNKKSSADKCAELFKMGVTYIFLRFQLFLYSDTSAAKGRLSEEEEGQKIPC